MDVKEKQREVNVFKKVFTLGILYFVQGLPYGFQDKFIPTYLRTSGLSHTKLSLMKLLLLPWLCKAAFAPVIDIFVTKWFALLCSLVCLAGVSFFGMLVSPEMFILVCSWLFMLNLFSAVQDIAVDGLALQILRENEIGQGNTAQVLGYKLGALSGGGVLFWIHLYFGWTGLCLSLFFLYVLSIITFLPLYERTEKKKKSLWHRQLSISEVDQVSLMYDTTIGEACGVNKEMQLRHRLSPSAEKKLNFSENISEEDSSIWDHFETVFQTKGTIPLIVFLLFYKLGERGALSTFPLFLIDQGVTTEQLGLWSGIVGQTASIFGSIFGGWLLGQKKLVQVLHFVCVARCVPILLQWFIINLWTYTTLGIVHSFLFFVSVISLIMLEFFAGVATTTIFSLMMSCSLRAPSTVQGTHYSVLSSVEVAGKLIFSSFIGALIDWLGLSSVYMILVLLSAFIVFIISYLI